MRQTRVLSVLVAGAVAVGTLLAAAAPATAAATDTTTTLESSVNPSTAGQEITLTATVVGDSPTGEVAFEDAGAPLGTVVVASGVATLTLDTLGVGDHALTATYAGDASNNVSQGDLTQTVDAADTTTTLTSSANPSTAGDELTLTATVTGSSPTGQVTFEDAGTALDTVDLSSGVATLTLSSLAVGDHALTATYSGDASNNSSEGDLTQTVVAAPTATTTALTSSLNPSTAGQSVTLTATVTGSSPTGQVTFADAGTPLGTVALASGVATLTTSSLGVGGHALTAAYGGDAHNTGSQGTLTQTVSAPPPPPPPPPPPTTPAPPAPVVHVKAPTVKLVVSTTKASVGDKVRLSWRSKNADSVLASGDWNGAQTPKGSTEIRITERGKHVFKLTVHNSAGSKTATVKVMAARKAKALELVVTDELTMVGSVVQVTADGLAKAEEYTIRLDGKSILTGKANSKGDVARTFTLAATTPEGALPLTITGSNPGRLGSGVLNVIKPKKLDVKLAAAEANKTSEQTLTVTGLAAGETVTVTYKGKELTTTGKADADGVFTYKFNVGKKAGKRTVKVVGADPSRTGTATFTVLDQVGGGSGGGGGGGGPVEPPTSL